jgi:3-oxoacyl-[acyl-carrier protein] reductase
VLFLASPLASRHISGETLTVAGGMEGRSLWKSGEIDEAAVRARLAAD